MRTFERQHGMAQRSALFLTVRWLSFSLIFALAVGVCADGLVAEEKPDASSTDSKDSAEIAALDKRVNEALSKKITLKKEYRSLRESLLDLSLQQNIPIVIYEFTFDDLTKLDQPFTVKDNWATTFADSISVLIRSIYPDANTNYAMAAKDGALRIGIGSDLFERTPEQKKSDAEDPTTLIRGKVKTVSGEPAANCKLVVGESGPTILVCTNKDGEFSFPLRRSGGRSVAIMFASEDESEMAVFRVKPERSAASAVAPLAPLDVPLEKIKPVAIALKDKDGNAVSDANAVVTDRGNAYSHVQYSKVTNENGKCVINVPESLEIGFIYAFKSDVGIDYRCYLHPNRLDYNTKAPTQPTGEVQLTFAKTNPITIKYVDDQDQPITDMKVNLWHMRKPDEAQILNGARFYYAKTDSVGEVKFNWIPEWLTSMTFFASSQEFSRPRLDFHTTEGSQPPVQKLARQVSISGTILDADDKPAAGAYVSISGAGYGFDDHRASAVSDENGKFVAKVMPHQLYMFVAGSKDQKYISDANMGVPVFPGKPVDGIELKLKPSTRIFGQLTLGTDKMPIANQYMRVSQNGTGLHAMKGVTFPHKPEEKNRSVTPQMSYSAQTGADGRFEFHVGPGTFHIWGTDQQKPQKFVVTDQKEIEFNFHSERPDVGSLTGRVVTGNPPTPVEMATVDGRTRRVYGEINAITPKDGTFKVQRKLHEAVVTAFTKDHKLAGIVEIGPDDTDVTIPIAPTANYTLKLMGEDGKPLPMERSLHYGVQVYEKKGSRNSPFMTLFGSYKIHPDAEGKIYLKGLVIGWKYDISLESVTSLGSSRTVKSIQPGAAGDFDLGEVICDEKEYKPPTLEERIEAAFKGQGGSASKRHSGLKNPAKLAYAHILITFADPKSEQTKQLFEQYTSGDARTPLNNEYRTLAISTAEKNLESAKKLADELGVELPTDGAPMVVAEDWTGKMLATISGEQLFDSNNKIKKNDLTKFVTKNRPKPLDGTEMFNEALAKAKSENKRVLIQETAVWCPPCQRLSQYLDQTRATWEKDLIWIKLDQRWNGTQEIMMKLRKKRGGGIPWVIVLDADQKELATAMMPNPDAAVDDEESKEQNIGFPTEKPEIDHYMKLFKTVAQRMTDEDLASLRKVLEPKK